MDAERLLLTLLCFGGVGHAVAVAALARQPAWRNIAHVGFSGLTALVSLSVLLAVMGEHAPAIALAWPTSPGELALRAEPIGALVAALIACSGCAISVYAVGYIRAVREQQPARLQAVSGLAVSMACTAAFADSLITFFIFYMALAICVSALVVHASNGRAARAGGRALLVFLLCGLGAFLPATIWTESLAGDVTFLSGGILEGKVSPAEGSALLALFFVGLGAMACPPLQGWTRDLALAPSPSASLGLAVLMPGVLGVGLLKITLFIFGPALIEAHFTRPALIALCAFSMLAHSVAMTRREGLRARLVDLAAVQMASIALGALLGGSAGALGAVLQLAAGCFSSLALFLAIGSVWVATARDDARATRGLARELPLSFLAFAIAALSAAGTPPLAGAWPRLWLAAGAQQAQYWPVAIALLISGFLTFAALVAPAVRAVIDPAPEDPFTRPDGASLLLSVPAAVAGAAAIGLVLALDPLSQIIAFAVEAGR
jgi:multicomponent Na+:H+ antiporter subunit D